MIEVLVLVDLPPGRFFNLTNLLKEKSKLVIGRKREGSIADIYLGEGILKSFDQAALQGVSRQHATLTCDEHGRICIKDHSTYGTKVNGEPLAKDEERVLNDGDRLLFGAYRYGPVICTAYKKN